MPSTKTHRSPAALLALVLVAVVACSELGLEQRNPGSILARDVYKPENAQLLVSGAIGDFECAFHRYVNAPRIFRCSCIISLGAMRHESAAGSRAFRRQRWNVSSPTLGQATYANWRT